MIIVFPVGLSFWHLIMAHFIIVHGARIVCKLFCRCTAMIYNQLARRIPISPLTSNMHSSISVLDSHNATYVRSPS